MILDCVRPGCINHFDSRGGEIYTLEKRPGGTTEFYWMCPECRREYGLSQLDNGELEVVPKSDLTGQIPPNPKADLRMFPGRFWRRLAA